MAKYKSYNYSQTVLLPVSLEDQLMPGTIEFAIHTLVEERMDVSRFDERYNNDETGATAIHPKPDPWYCLNLQWAIYIAIVFTVPQPFQSPAMLSRTVI